MNEIIQWRPIFVFVVETIIKVRFLERFFFIDRFPIYHRSTPAIDSNISDYHQSYQQTGSSKSVAPHGRVWKEVVVSPRGHYVDEFVYRDVLKLETSCRHK